MIISTNVSFNFHFPRHGNIVSFLGRSLTHIHLVKNSQTFIFLLFIDGTIAKCGFSCLVALKAKTKTRKKESKKEREKERTSCAVG